MKINCYALNQGLSNVINQKDGIVASKIEWLLYFFAVLRQTFMCVVHVFGNEQNNKKKYTRNMFKFCDAIFAGDFILK